MGGVGRVAPVALALATAVAIGGCAVQRVVEATPDTFETWSNVPLPPDPALAAAAIRETSACAAAQPPEQMRVLIQDRRAARTAAFLVMGATTFGGCIVSLDQASSGGSGPLPEAMTGPMSIDDNGGGDFEGQQVRELGGRAAPNIASVDIELTDGRTFKASVGNGWWLAWWLTQTRAKQVVGRDAAGTVVATVEVPL